MVGVLREDIDAKALSFFLSGAKQIARIHHERRLLCEAV
jgi:hypothetical protein